MQTIIDDYARGKARAYIRSMVEDVEYRNQSTAQKGTWLGQQVALMNPKWLAALIGAEKARDTSGNVRGEIICYTEELNWDTLATKDVERVVNTMMGHISEIKGHDPACFVTDN